MEAKVKYADLERAVARYESNLGAAEQWLAGRGIPMDVARAHRLGVVVDPAPGDERYTGWLSIPYVTPGGVRAVKFRCLQQHECKDFGHGKYGAPAGQRPRLYGVESLHSDSAYIAIAEGEIDRIVLSHLCGIPAVGIPGVDNWKSYMPLCFVNFSKVFIFADHDAKEDGRNPGRELGRRIAKDLDQAVLLTLPKGMDVNELYVSQGAEAVRGLAGV